MSLLDNNFTSLSRALTLSVSSSIRSFELCTDSRSFSTVLWGAERAAITCYFVSRLSCEDNGVETVLERLPELDEDR